MEAVQGGCYYVNVEESIKSDELREEVESTPVPGSPYSLLE